MGNMNRFAGMHKNFEGAIVTISMYSASAPVFMHSLKVLDDLLKKAQDYAMAKKIDPAVMLGLRLYPDMLPLNVQVFITCAFARNSMLNLSGQTPPQGETPPADFAGLHALIADRLKFLASVTPQMIDGTEQKEVTFKVAGNPKTLKGEPYLKHWVIPNFFFHITTAYGILRHNGVEVGKADFLGQVD
jgi:uncharacterized protein